LEVVWITIFGSCWYNMSFSFVPPSMNYSGPTYLFPLYDAEVERNRRTRLKRNNT
jgi:hypothetical protein